jgi:ATP-dependent protease ClpP protease subunit
MPTVYKSAAAILNLQRDSARKDWYRIENKASGPAQVSIYDEIGMWGVSAGQFISDLAAVKGDIEVHLSSPGGEVFDGIAIYNALRKRNPTIVVDAIAASIASVIAMAAAPGQLFMEPTARMMIHDGFAMAAGNADELAKMVEQLNEASDTIAGIYAERTGKPQADWRAAMKEETWYGAEAAVEAGLADGIWQPDVTNKLLNSAHAHCPGCSAHVTDLQAKFCGQCGGQLEASFSEGDPAAGGFLAADAPQQLGDGWVQDADGTKRFDPDGDGDDDSTAEGDTDHDYWDADGKQLKDIPPCPSGDDEVTNFLVSAIMDAAQPHGKMTGSHSHPHPAYGSQGGDASHDHAHSHNNDASHSHSHAKPDDADDTSADDVTDSAGKGDDQDDDSKKPFPGAAPPFKKKNQIGTLFAPAPYTRQLGSNVECPVCRKFNNNDARFCDQCGTKLIGRSDVNETAGPGTPVGWNNQALVNSDVDSSTWNASKAWHNGATSDDPAKFYAGICAGKKAGDPATQAAWALPYKYTPDSPPNAGGVKAALSRLPQTEGLTNEADAKKTLQAAMKIINPDYEPDDVASVFLFAHQVLLEG